MEAFAFYLLKSVIWLSGFALVYLLFLRNERFFLLNRFYLLAGILASLFFPFISIHYTVIVPVTETTDTGNIIVNRIGDPETSALVNLSFMLIVFYLTGSLFFIYKLLRQSRTVIKVIKKAKITSLHSMKLIRTSEYTNSFSFFSYVFVNPSVTDIETNEIVNHEMAHIRQWHWFDLVLVELLCLLQWFNPVVWIYVRFIRQNHEYLADEVALQRTSDPALYRAALLNQIVGSPVIILANSFNYSINKKRFIMMKNKISSPYRKMKLLLILPVIAVVLYSFAKPEYKYFSNESINVDGTLASQNTKEVKGTVVSPAGKPLAGTTIMLRGTNIGVTADTKGFFKLDNVPESGLLVISYVGFKTRVIKPDFSASMTIKLDADTVNLHSIGIPPPPPPPPPPSMVSTVSPEAGVPPPPPPPVSGVRIRNTDGSEAKPLIVIDGIKKGKDALTEINPNEISNMNVIKDKRAMDLYGEEGKDGVIEITTKKNDLSLVVIDGAITERKIKDIPVIQMEKMQWVRGPDAIDKYGEIGKNGVYEITTRDQMTKLLNEPSDVKVTGYGENQKIENNVFMVVEEMPAFPGGEKALQSYIYSHINVVKGSEKTAEPVLVVFTVGSNGKVRDAHVLKKKYPVWEAEAIRVVSSMPEWKPGKQHGIPVDVMVQLPIDFNTVKK